MKPFSPSKWPSDVPDNFKYEEFVFLIIFYSELITIFRAFGTQIKFIPETDELLVTAGESDRVYMIALKESYKIRLIFDPDSSILHKEENTVSAKLCAVMEKPKNGPKNVKIRAKILSDPRLTKTDSDIVEIG